MKKFLLLFLLLASNAFADNWTFKFDDDILKIPGLKNYDKNYTDGYELSDEREDNKYYIGQLAYTPGHKQLSVPQPDDRPYAGYAYAGWKANYVRSQNIQDTFGIQLGIVGPHSYAGRVQKEFHKLIGQKVPKGWGTQLHDEPQLMAIAERKFRFPVNKYIDFIDTIGANLGTPFTQAYAGPLLRVGYNLPLSFNSSDPIFPRVAHPGETPPKPTSSLYGFAGVYGRAVAANVFLDGNSWHDSASIDKNIFVGEGRLGIAGEYKGYRLGYTYVVLLEEYKGENNGMDFGEIMFSKDF